MGMLCHGGEADQAIENRCSDFWEAHRYLPLLSWTRQCCGSCWRGDGVRWWLTCRQNRLSEALARADGVRAVGSSPAVLCCCIEVGACPTEAPPTRPGGTPGSRAGGMLLAEVHLRRRVGGFLWLLGRRRVAAGGEGPCRWQRESCQRWWRRCWRGGRTASTTDSCQAFGIERRCLRRTRRGGACRWFDGVPGRRGTQGGGGAGGGKNFGFWVFVSRSGRGGGQVRDCPSVVP